MAGRIVVDPAELQGVATELLATQAALAELAGRLPGGIAGGAPPGLGAVWAGQAVLLGGRLELEGGELAIAARRLQVRALLARIADAPGLLGGLGFLRWLLSEGGGVDGDEGMGFSGDQKLREWEQKARRIDGFGRESETVRMRDKDGKLREVKLSDLPPEQRKKVEAALKIEREARADAYLFQHEGTFEHGPLSGKGGINGPGAGAGVKGGIVLDADGLGIDLGADVHATLIEAEGEAAVGVGIIGVGVAGKAGVSAKAEASAGVRAGPGGVKANVGAGAHAGGRAEASASANVSGAKVTAGGSVTVGIGAHAKADAEVSVDKVRVKVDIGATVGIGGSASIDVSIEPKEIVEDVAEGLDKAGDLLGDTVSFFRKPSIF